MPMMLSVLLPACSNSSLPSAPAQAKYNARSALGVSRGDRSFACRRAQNLNESRETGRIQLTGLMSQENRERTVRCGDQVAWYFSWYCFPVTVYKTVRKIYRVS
jgi:hypothetical protein